MDSRIYILGTDSVPSEIVLGEGESLSLTFVAGPGVSESTAIDVKLAGMGASLDLAGVYICPGEEVVDLKVNVSHLSAGCQSRQLFKGIVGGNAHASFNGLIYVARDAQKTKAFQENHSILLSSSAVAESRPQLEIYADDVECSHGATCGSLDEDAQFYMRSRGISEEEARRLQIISFLSPVLSRLPHDVSDRLGYTLPEE